MNDFTNTVTSKSLTVKLWRGERMCLLGMDVTNPEPDFVGFSIEVKSPGSPGFIPLRNRLAFSYPAATAPSTIDSKQFPSLEAPFQKFRWVHFPHNPHARNVQLPRYPPAHAQAPHPQTWRQRHYPNLPRRPPL